MPITIKDGKENCMTMKITTTLLITALPLILPAQTNMTRTTLQNVHLSGTAGGYTNSDQNPSPSIVFITYDLPGHIKSVVQANLVAPLSAASSAVAKSLNGHLTVTVTCSNFGLLTINNSTTGKVTTMGTGNGCTVDSLH